PILVVQDATLVSKKKATSRCPHRSAGSGGGERNRIGWPAGSRTWRHAEIAERSRDETDHRGGLHGGVPALGHQQQPCELGPPQLQWLSAVVEHLRQALQVPHAGRGAATEVLARLLRCLAELLQGDGRHRLGGVLQEPRLPDQRLWALRRRQLRARELRPGVRQPGDAVGHPLGCHGRAAGRAWIRRLPWHGWPSDEWWL